MSRPQIIQSLYQVSIASVILKYQSCLQEVIGYFELCSITPREYEKSILKGYSRVNFKTDCQVSMLHQSTLETTLSSIQSCFIKTCISTIHPEKIIQLSYFPNLARYTLHQASNTASRIQYRPAFSLKESRSQPSIYTSLSYNPGRSTVTITHDCILLDNEISSLEGANLSSFNCPKISVSPVCILAPAPVVPSTPYLISCFSTADCPETRSFRRYLEFEEEEKTSVSERTSGKMVYFPNPDPSLCLNPSEVPFVEANISDNFLSRCNEEASGRRNHQKRSLTS
ncbi:hypothetical protein O181_086207 [Austropuccinia psidii MF-1]|uniref:Uncharacterized protein n=1 Tax=Austropuccinia psidii MF-1 TaxID=1389203 RepID=A0A9Q3IM95_9BASI|nr:hypothetical protein [Austropuccinia psidii MF-1]